MDSERLGGKENEAERCPVRRARTYQHLLQESCTIWSLPIMHYDRGWSKQGREESEKHLLLVPSSQQSVVHRQIFLTKFSKMVLFFASNEICKHTYCTARAPRPHSSEMSRLPAKVCSINGTSG